MKLWKTCQCRRLSIAAFHKNLCDLELADSIAYKRALRQCGTLKALAEGKRIHEHILARGYEEESVWNHVFHMYMDCGCVAAAEQVLASQIPSCGDVMCWTRLISVHSQMCNSQQALVHFRQMELQGVKPDKVCFVAMLKACSRKEIDVNVAKSIHAQLVECGLQIHLPVANALLNMHGKRGELVDALRIFNEMPHRDVISWNVMITAYAQNRHYDEALDFFEEMLVGDVEPNKVTLLSTLNACTTPEFLEAGKMVHDCAIKYGQETDVAIGNALIHMYSRCDSLEDACKVFEGMQQRDVISWNVIISAYAQHDQNKQAFQHFQKAQQQGIILDEVSFVTILNACNDPEMITECKAIHCCIAEGGFESNTVVRNAIINMYGKCGSLHDARLMFDKLQQQRDVVSWNSMITAYIQRGNAESALELFQSMVDSKEMVPNEITFATTLQACDSPDALNYGKLVHACIIEHSYESHVVVGNALVNMYSKCGSLDDARKVFDNMGEKDIVAWNAMTSGYAQNGMFEESLHLFRKLQLERTFPPDRITYVSVLGACSSSAALSDGKIIHSCISESGCRSDVTIANAVVGMYSKCQSVADAAEVFDSIIQPSVMLCNTMIESYSQHGYLVDARALFERMGELKDVSSWNVMIEALAEKSERCGIYSKEAFRLYHRMQLQGYFPNKGTLVRLLNACSGPFSLQMGRLVHAHVVESGYSEVDDVLGSAIVKMYGKCGTLNEARTVFDGMGTKNVVAWTTMMAAYAQSGEFEKVVELYREMLLAELKPDNFTFVTILNACANMVLLEEGKLVHEQVIESGCESDVVVGNALVTMYGKCCDTVETAVEIFRKMPRYDVVSWNAMIGVYIHHHLEKQAIGMFRTMQMEGVGVNNISLISILSACSSIGSLADGKFIHSVYDRQDIHVENAILNMYCKCGSVDEAKEMFKEMVVADVVTWNVMLASYVHEQEKEEAMLHFQYMQLEGVKPNNISFVTLLNLCGGSEDLAKGKKFHDLISPQSDLLVGNALVYMYGKCDSIDDARKVFKEMHQQDVITWNGMMAAYAKNGRCSDVRRVFDEMNHRDNISWHIISTVYAQHGECDEAVYFLRRMLLHGVKLTTMTLVGILGSCASATSLREGKQVHALSIHSGIDVNVFVGTAIVDMYSKCGNVEEARKVFDKLSEREIVTWNVMIAAYANHGYSREALKLFTEMQREGTKPNDATFVSILAICSHAGLLDDGRQYFSYMCGEYGIRPAESHCGCMIDLLSRAGRLEEAEEFVKRLGVGELLIPMMALLSACKVQGDVKRGKHAANAILQHNPLSHGANLVLSHIYAAHTA